LKNENFGKIFEKKLEKTFLKDLKKLEKPENFKKSNVLKN
jgi:hypothetical protein